MVTPWVWTASRPGIDAEDATAGEIDQTRRGSKLWGYWPKMARGRVLIGPPPLAASRPCAQRHVARHRLTSRNDSGQTHQRAGVTVGRVWCSKSDRTRCVRASAI